MGPDGNAPMRTEGAGLYHGATFGGLWKVVAFEMKLR